MAEVASTPPEQSPAARRAVRRAEAASLTAPLRADAPTGRLAADRSTSHSYESAADRYSFYFFMGTIALGILSMIVMSFSI